MLSRRMLFGLGLGRVAERVEEQFAAADLEPAPPLAASPPPRRVPARPRGVPPPGPSWPHKRGAELWAPVSAALPRPPGARVLEVDELDADLGWLPAQEAEYDAAVSAFAPMFSFDPAASIAELLRVVRPGGLVAFTAWTPAGVVGRLLALADEHEPPQPGAVVALDWGRPARLREELARHSDDFELQSAGLTLEFASREEALDRLFAALRPLAWAPRQPELRALAAPLAGLDTGPVSLRATYVMAVVHRRSD